MNVVCYDYGGYGMSQGNEQGHCYSTAKNVRNVNIAGQPTVEFILTDIRAVYQALIRGGVFGKDPVDPNDIGPHDTGWSVPHSFVQCCTGSRWGPLPRCNWRRKSKSAP